ncbi:MAG: hypothetical protein JJ895_07900 [Balneolaceae bacterium]|nr:hypothetical protein [Balneolaceae bacterium]
MAFMLYVITYSIFFISSCNDVVEPEYLKKISFLDHYEYLDDLENRKTVSDTIITYSIPTDSVLISAIGDVEEISKYKLWVSDNVLGNIYEFDLSDSRFEKIYVRGRGPNQVISPTLLSKESIRGDSIVYILDTNQKSLILSSLYGNDLNRYYIKEIPGAIRANKMFIQNENSFHWPIYSDDHFLLANFDTLGNLKEKYIRRLIPLGKQPENHNTIFFDYDQTGENFAYAYIGIPLIFIETSNNKVVINLLPNAELEELNVGLDILPYETNTKVNRVIRSLDIYRDRLIIGLNNEIFVVSIDEFKIMKKIKLIDQNRTPLIYHSIKVSGEHLYLINLFNSTISRVNLNDIVN